MSAHLRDGVRAASAAGWLALWGCEGQLLAPQGPQPGEVVQHGDPASPDDEKPCQLQLPARLVLLSDYQQANAIRSLLGVAALAADAALNAQTKPFTQKGVVVNASLVHGRQSWAAEASRSLAERFTDITGCAADDTDDCARTFIARFAEQAFRRKVAAEEVDDLMAVHALGKQTSYVNGVGRMVEAVLSAPSFMYRSELGSPDGAGHLVLRPEEVATTLSFMLTDAPPDAELLSAAESGGLDDVDGVTAQVERLLATPLAQASLVSTLMAAWNLSNLFGTVKDPGLYPEYGPSLQASMFHETELFLSSHLFDEEAPLAELLTSRKSFVNPRLAALYGVEYPGEGDDFLPVTLPETRAGVFTQPAVMAMLARTDNTSVVARGLFVRGALLCLPKIPAPPADLEGAIEDLLEADMTERERAEVRGTTEPCKGCHAGFDGFGLLVENFDPLGRERSEVGGEPVDTRVELVTPESLSGAYPDFTAFAQKLATGDEFTSCVATKLLSYALNDDALNAQSCLVRDAVEGLGEAPSLREVVQAVVGSKAFRLRRTEKP